MITADQARNLMPENKIKKVLEHLSSLIESAASLNRTSIRMPDEYINTDGGDGSVSMHREPLATYIKKLESLGYSVKSFYKADQFVDSGVTISWVETKDA